jgi:hypothetical protein
LPTPGQFDPATGETVSPDTPGLTQRLIASSAQKAASHPGFTSQAVELDKWVAEQRHLRSNVDEPSMARIGKMRLRPEFVKEMYAQGDQRLGYRDPVTGSMTMSPLARQIDFYAQKGELKKFQDAYVKKGQLQRTLQQMEARGITAGPDYNTVAQQLANTDQTLRSARVQAERNYQALSEWSDLRMQQKQELGEVTRQRSLALSQLDALKENRANIERNIRAASDPQTRKYLEQTLKQTQDQIDGAQNTLREMQRKKADLSIKHGQETQRLKEAHSRGELKSEPMITELPEYKAPERKESLPETMARAAQAEVERTKSEWAELEAAKRKAAKALEKQIESVKGDVSYEQAIEKIGRSIYETGRRERMAAEAAKRAQDIAKQVEHVQRIAPEQAKAAQAQAAAQAARAAAAAAAFPLIVVGKKSAPSGPSAPSMPSPSESGYISAGAPSISSGGGGGDIAFESTIS